MDKLARLEDVYPAWRLIASRLRALTPILPARIIPALRLGRRLLALSQPRLWWFGLAPIAVAVSILIDAGAPISWGLVAAEALAVICALSGWATLRDYRPALQSDFPHVGVGAGLFVTAALATAPLLASASVLTLPLSALALGVIALDLGSGASRAQASRAVKIVARRVLAPILLGLGLVMVTALTQGARRDATLWLIGVALSLLLFATIQAHALVMDGAIEDKRAPWRRPQIALAAALVIAGALVIAAALPVSAPHGLLLALGALPVALVAVTGFWRSTYMPARAWAAGRMVAVFTFVALALTAGALASALVAAAGSALFQALGG